MSHSIFMLSEMCSEIHMPSYPFEMQKPFTIDSCLLIVRIKQGYTHNNDFDISIFMCVFTNV